VRRALNIGKMLDEASGFVDESLPRDRSFEPLCELLGADALHEVRGS
jgi:hypothetical protein